MEYIDKNSIFFFKNFLYNSVTEYDKKNINDINELDDDINKISDNTNEVDDIQEIEEMKKTFNKEQKKTLEYIINNINNKKKTQIYIQGSAGTGKSYFIKKIMSFLSKKNFNIVPIAISAIASLNINGKTFNSEFLFKKEEDLKNMKIIKEHEICSVETCENNEIKVNYLNKKKGIFDDKNVFKNINIENWIIIDEISTVPLNVLDFLNKSFKKIYNSNETFGGINLIFLGDLFQLPPIDVKKMTLYKTDKNYFIYNMDFVEFIDIKRQTDVSFIELCENIKLDKITKENEITLKSRLCSNFDEKIYENSIYLYSTNVKCDELNKKKLLLLNKPIIEFVSFDNVLDKKNKYFNNVQCLEQNLKISVDSKVIVTCNLSKTLLNGIIGTVEEIYENDKLITESKKIFLNENNLKNYRIKIVLENGNKEFLNVVIKNETNIKNNISYVTYERANFPLKLSWAITIHKIQGMTLNNIIMDIGFRDDISLIYVAITRIKTLNNLFIENLNLPIKKDYELLKKINFLNILRRNNNILNV